jgi:PleD family two-component response regulator
MSTEDRISVLLIDSNDTDRSYYAHRLKQNSSEYVVHLAATGQDGLETYQARPIDCVVLELDLADMSGFEVLVRLVPVACKREVAIVFLSHLSNFHLADLAMKNGAVTWLLKSRTSGDMLDKAILRAISVISIEKKKTQDDSIPPPDQAESL